MDEEYCKKCQHFYYYLNTLAKPDKHFTPTCTIDGTFKLISEIEKCTMFKSRIPLCPNCGQEMTSGRVSWQWYCMNKECIENDSGNNRQ